MTKTMLCLEDIGVPSLKILCLTWASKGSRRMYEIRSILKAEIWNYSIFFRMRPLAPIKYPVQAINTFIKLMKTRPDIVVVQNPPIFAALVCLIYRRFFGARIIIDHHFIWSMSNILKNPVIRSFIGSIESFCIKTADLNITYADPWEYELTRIGAKETLTIYDFVDEAWSKDADPSVRREFPKNKKIIVMPVGGHPLERPGLLIEACRELDAMVLITGERKFLRRHMARTRELGAGNVVFTGFLPYRKYRGLIVTCDFVANISEEPYGIPHALCEALASGRPIIISENPAVRKLLGDNCPLILSNNDVDTIRRTFLSAFENQGEYVKLAEKFYKGLKERKERQVERFFERIRSLEPQGSGG